MRISTITDRRTVRSTAATALALLVFSFGIFPAGADDAVDGGGPQDHATQSPTPSSSPTTPAPQPTEGPTAEQTPLPSPSDAETSPPSTGDDLNTPEAEVFDPSLDDGAPTGEEPQSELAPEEEDLSERVPLSVQPTDYHDFVRLEYSAQIGHGWNARRTVFPGDWDRDGKTDLMLITPSGDLLFYRSLGWDQFEWPVKIGHGWGAALDVLGGTDWTGDGYPDLLARFRNGEVHFYVGDARGGVRSHWKIGQGWQPFRTITVLSRSLHNSPALLGVREDGASWLYPTKGTTEFLDPILIDNDWRDLGLVTGVGDWDGNGQSDVAAIDHQGTLRYLAANAHGGGFTHFRLGTGWSKMKGLNSAFSPTGNRLWAIREDGTLHSYILHSRDSISQGYKLDRRCLTGRVLCSSKSAGKLWWVIDGEIKATMDARFGWPSTPTREGVFKVFRKSRHHVSSIFGVPMPWAMFFSGGQAIHYSEGFASDPTGAGGSAGCINIRDAATLDWVYHQVRIGDKVVVYR